MSRTSRQFRSGSAREERAGRLLTPASRRVITPLLDDPRLEIAPLRVLAEAAGVSVGQTHKSVMLLTGAAYPREQLDETQRAVPRRSRTRRA